MDREQPSIVKKNKGNRLELAPTVEPPSSGNVVIKKGKAHAKKLRYSDPLERESIQRNVARTDVDITGDVGGEEEKMEIEAEERVLPGAYRVAGMNYHGRNETDNAFREALIEDFSNLPVGELVNEEYPEGEVLNLQQIVENSVQEIVEDSKKAVKKRLFFIFGIILTVVAIAVGIISTRQPSMPSVPTSQPSISMIPSTLPSVSSSPSSMPTTIQSDILEAIESQLPSSQNNTRREGTAQYIALNWIMDNYDSITSSFVDDDKFKLLQIYSLVVLYHSTNGNNWKSSDNWLDIFLGDDVRSWYGVSWSIRNGVTKLDLSNNNLVGSIPDEVVFFGSINSIYLTDNRLDGISKEIASLSSLDSLWLHNNELTGRIPEEVAELMVSTLQKKYSEYYDVISEKVPMSRTTIHKFGTLQYRSFQTIMYRIENGDIVFREDDLWLRYVLTLLYYNNGGDGWSWKDNFISSGDYCGWNSYRNGLRRGVLCNNNNDVVELLLYDNNLQGTIPAELGALTMLTYLHLGRNSLTETIPTDIGRLTALERFYLNENQLTGTMSQIGKLTKLTSLSLGDNQLSGNIPAAIGSLTGLTGLTLSNNKLSGPIPRQFGKLTKLTSLKLNNNELSGNITTLIGELTALKRLWLKENNLSGSIPEVLCWADIDIDCDKVAKCSCCECR